MRVDFVELAQQSPSAEAFETGVLAILGRVVGFDAAMFLVKGLEPFATIVGLESKVAKRLVTRGETYARELMPVKRAALAARGVAIDTEVCGIERVRKTHYYREAAATVDGTHSLMAYVPWRGSIAAAMMLGRGGSGFSRQEVALVESLLPELGVARAAYGFPWVGGPLPSSSKDGLLHRLGIGDDSRVLASVRTQTGTLIVRDRAGFREMVARDGASELTWTRASLTGSNNSGWPYVELFHLAPALAKRRRRALFVGSGGGVGLRQFASVYPGITIDLVEHEPAVIELARTWFDLSSIPNTRVHIADGAAFIRNAAPSSWDIVVIDAYDAAGSAAHFFRRDFLGVLRQALQPGGAIACNVIGRLSGSGQVADFVRSARAVFDSVRVVPVVDLEEEYASHTLRNVVIVATRDD